MKAIAAIVTALAIGLPSLGAAAYMAAPAAAGMNTPADPNETWVMTPPPRATDAPTITVAPSMTTTGTTTPAGASPSVTPTDAPEATSPLLAAPRVELDGIIKDMASFSWSEVNQDALYACELDGTPSVCNTSDMWAETKTYKRLESGEHTFRVIAMTNDGIPISEPSELITFTIE